MPPRKAPSDGSKNRGEASAHTAAVSKATVAEPDCAAALDVALERLVQCLTPAPHAWARRQSLLADHIQCLRQAWRGFPDIRIQPFGSSLSGLCLADSDIDLGLFGSMHQVDLEAITPQQAKQLLYSVLGAIQRTGLADGKVQTVMGARVPVLKYTCALSGLDCDVSIQSSGALLKANFMALLNRHCPNLSPLYRLVKLWASAHDLNDASRSTFNSTSLLYMTAFFLQTRQLVPPLSALVDPALLNDPCGRPLQTPNKWLWDRPQHLTQLLSAAQQRMDAWVSTQQRRHGNAWARHSLGGLLQGFFAFYSDLFMDWVLGKSREVYADLWEGQLTSHHIPDEQLGKDYLFNLQDPFDPVDCPARAIGTMVKDNNGIGVLITYLMSGSNSAMQRLLNPSSTTPSSSSSRHAGARHQGSSSSSDTGGSAEGLQHRLCQCLAWLFGPQAVLLLSPAETVDAVAISAAASTVSGFTVAAAGGATSSNGSSSSRVEWRVWAACPFDVPLAAHLQSWRQQQEKQQQRGSKHGRGGRGHAESSATQFRWLVSFLAAALEPEHGPCVLCLEHLSLLNKRIDAGHLSGPFGEALCAGAVRRRADSQQQRDRLEADRLVWQRQLLPGPPLPQPHPRILQLYHSFTSVLKQQRWQPHEDKPPRPAASQAKPVKDAARHVITQVAQCMQALAAPHQHQQDNHSLDEAEGIGGYGLKAVLEQHGFMPVLQRWGFLSDGVLWHKLLPLPEHLQQHHQQPQDHQQQHHHQSHLQQQQEAHPSEVQASADGSSHAGGGSGDYQLLLQHLQAQGATSTPVQAAVHAAADGSGHEGGGGGGFQVLLQHLQAQGPSSTPEQAAGSSRQEAQPAGAGRAVSGMQFLQQVLHKQQQQHKQHPDLQNSVAGVTSDFQQMGLDTHTAFNAAAANSGSSGHNRARGVPGHQQHHPVSQEPQASSPVHIQQQQRHPHKQQPNSHSSTSPQAAGVRVVPRARQHHSRSPASASVSLPIDIAEPAAGSTLAMHGDGLAAAFCRQLQEKISSPPARSLSSAVCSPEQGAAGQQQGGRQRAKHGKQQQEQQHPAAAMLGPGRYESSGYASAGSSYGSSRLSASSAPAAPGLSTAGSSYGSSRLFAASPPAAARVSPPTNMQGRQQRERQQQQHQPAPLQTAHAAGSAAGSAAAPQGFSVGSSSHTASSCPTAGSPLGPTPLANKAQLRVQKAKYKVQQLQQQIDKAERDVEQKQVLLESAETQIEVIMALAGDGGEQDLDQDSRQELLVFKQQVMRNSQSVKMLTNNLHLFKLKLQAAQEELRQAEAAAAAGP